MKRTSGLQHTGLSFAKLVSVIILLAMGTGILVLSEFIVQSLWDKVAVGNIPRVLPWYLLLLFLSFSFFDCFDFAAKRYHVILYSCIFSIIVSSVIVIILPVEMVGENVSKKIMLVSCVLMCIGSAVWLKIARDIFFHYRKPSSTVLVTDKHKELWLTDKINDSTRIFHVDSTASPSDENIEEIISGYEAVAIGTMSADEKKKIIGLCASLEKTVLLRPEYTDIMLMTAQTEQFDDLMMIRAGAFGFTESERAVKRIFDIILSAIGLVLISPVMLVCIIAILMDDGKNPFYLQERLTRGGKRYNVIKLRTMIYNAEEISGPVLAEENDPRITKVGRVLRKMRLDEWPQIFNILKVDMTIVGPRPERDFFYDKICSVIPEFRHRLSVKAGLTGMAQVYGRYSTDPYEKLMLDLTYIQNYSILLDLKIMIETVRVVFEKDAAKGTSEESDVKKRASRPHKNDDGTEEKA